jgi:hypothetical protein
MMPSLFGREQPLGSHAGPVIVRALTCASLLTTATPLSKPVIRPGPLTFTSISPGRMLTPAGPMAATWQLPANPDPVEVIV